MVVLGLRDQILPGFSATHSSVDNPLSAFRLESNLTMVGKATRGERLNHVIALLFHQFVEELMESGQLSAKEDGGAVGRVTKIILITNVHSGTLMVR